MCAITPDLLQVRELCGNVFIHKGLTPEDCGRAMRFSEIYKQNDFALSYELFPPKTPKGAADLSGNLERLLTFKPRFVTCTYGAGGSTRNKTLETLKEVQRLTDVPVASHLTCVNATADDLRDYLTQASDQGIDNIVAIRGDAPEGQESFSAIEGGFSYASDLVSLIASEFPQFGIAVGGYPEVHPEAASAESDLDALKRKVDCGADVIITQLFYDNEHFYRFKDRCDGAGIAVPIVPGLLPVTSFKQIKRITDLCGAKLPDAFTRDLEACGDDTEAQFQVGVAHAARQSAELLEHGVPGIHYYVLNKSRATTSVLMNISLPGDSG